MSNPLESPVTYMDPKIESMPPDSRGPRRLVLLAGAAILIISVSIAVFWMRNKPKAHRNRPAPQASLVAVEAVTRSPQTIVVTALGEVVPARTIQLAARVSGEVMELSDRFEPGGIFNTGDTILRLDPEDYRLQVQQRTSELAKAEAQMQLEMGQQDIAQGEYELLGRELAGDDSALLLREPQRTTAAANVAIARSALKQAQLNLQRTRITAPFNVMVQTRNVNTGSQVSQGSSLAQLVGTDQYWVEISVPVNQLQWIRIPGYNSPESSTVRIYHESAWGPDRYRSGRVIRLTGSIESADRMARVLVAVDDPLELSRSPVDRTPLLLGSFVRMEIIGQELPGAVSIPRTALRDGRAVWIMDPISNSLLIRPVTVVWSSNDHVLITDGLQTGDLLVVSDLSAPVQGMALRTGDDPGTAGSGPAGAALDDSPGSTS